VRLGHLRWASEEPAGYVVSYTLQTYLKHDPVTVALPWSLRESISYTYSLMLFLNCPKAPQTDARYNYLWYGHKYNNVSAASSLGMKLKTNTLFRYAYLPMAGIIPRSIDKIFESLSWLGMRFEDFVRVVSVSPFLHLVLPLLYMSCHV
jgi:hypothetical protein